VHHVGEKLSCIETLQMNYILTISDGLRDADLHRRGDPR
jgi:hypothetical protein